MNTIQHYIQYHNADKLGNFPTLYTDFNASIDQLMLDNSVKYDEQFYTSKKLVEKAIGHYCFMIVGKTEKFKKYYLWSYFRIDDYLLDADKYYNVNGTGFDFAKPILLNDLEHFKSFKNFCGNFGIGFQNIDKHFFLSTLISFVDKIGNLIPSQPNANNFKDDLKNAIMELNHKMQHINPEKRNAEIMQTLRKDNQMVELLKKVANHKCQFPKCESLVMKADGINYVEVAHIKPVKDGGQSILGNIIVLCPNHHKEFDYGVLNVAIQTEQLLEGQLNGKKFIIKTLGTE